MGTERRARLTPKGAEFYTVDEAAEEIICRVAAAYILRKLASEKAWRLHEPSGHVTGRLTLARACDLREEFGGEIKHDPMPPDS